MRLQLLAPWLGFLLLIGGGAEAHPGDNGFWLIEVEDHLVTSRILLPGHLFIHFPGLDANHDGIVDRAELIRSRDKMIEVLEQHLDLQTRPALKKARFEELFLESSGFVEVATSYHRDPAAQRMRVSSSLHGILGDDHEILCRVLGGHPEQSVLNAQTGSIELKLVSGEAESEQIVSARNSTHLVVYTLVVVLSLGLMGFGIKRFKHSRTTPSVNKG